MCCKLSHQVVLRLACFVLNLNYVASSAFSSAMILRKEAVSSTTGSSANSRIAGRRNFLPVGPAPPSLTPPTPRAREPAAQPAAQPALQRAIKTAARARRNAAKLPARGSASGSLDEACRICEVLLRTFPFRVSDPRVV